MTTITGQKDNSTTNLSGSRNLNLNNYVWNTNWNNGFVAVCEHLCFLHSLTVKALMVRPLNEMVSFLSYASKHITRSVKIGVLKNRNYKTAIKENNLMGKKYKNLFEQIVDIDNIRLAYNKAVAGGNRYGSSHLVFKENLEHNLFLIQEELKNESKEISNKIKDLKVLKLLKLFINDVGIHIGNLLSKLFANIYGHIFDRFIKTKLKIKHYFRYMDDTVILLNDKSKLIYIQRVLQRFISMFMKLKFSKWFINSVESKGLNFLGYRIREKYKLIRKDSVVRAKRKIKKYKLNNDFEQLEKFLGSWTGHIKTCDSSNLKFYIKREYDLWNNKQLA